MEYNPNQGHHCYIAVQGKKAEIQYSRNDLGSCENCVNTSITTRLAYVAVFLFPIEPRGSRAEVWGESKKLLPLIFFVTSVPRALARLPLAERKRKRQLRRLCSLRGSIESKGSLDGDEM